MHSYLQIPSEDRRRPRQVTSIVETAGRDPFSHRNLISELLKGQTAFPNVSIDFARV